MLSFVTNQEHRHVNPDLHVEGWNNDHRYRQSIPANAHSEAI
jgi:hypothetical protein